MVPRHIVYSWWGVGHGGTEEGAVVSYPDPDSHSCGWITSPLRATLFPRSGDVIHPQLWESGSGYETKGAVAWHHRWQWQYLRMTGPMGAAAVAYPGFQRGGCLRSGPIRKVGRGGGGGGGPTAADRLHHRYVKEVM